VIRDIDTVHKYVEAVKQAAGKNGVVSPEGVRAIAQRVPEEEANAFSAAVTWLAGGARSIFLQDANSVIVKPPDFIEIVTHLRRRFPWIERITSYARSHTLARIKDADLTAFRAAGLNRIHVGMESGSDEVLKRVKKGSNKAMQIKAGQKARRAGMELSEYVMPGLGGRLLWREHALETADALNRINPDFIRFRTLAIRNGIPLETDIAEGRFQKPTDEMIVKELLLLLENLQGIDSVVKSDHILNLFEDLEGKLPEDRDRMVEMLNRFLEMDPESRCLYQTGRRLGLFRGLSDMSRPDRVKRAEAAQRELGITPDTIDAFTDDLIKRFI
jgi:hypothetical protein